MWTIWFSLLFSSQFSFLDRQFICCHVLATNCLQQIAIISLFILAGRIMGRDHVVIFLLAQSNLMCPTSSWCCYQLLKNLHLVTNFRCMVSVDVNYPPCFGEKNAPYWSFVWSFCIFPKWELGGKPSKNYPNLLGVHCHGKIFPKWLDIGFFPSASNGSK